MKDVLDEMVIEASDIKLCNKCMTIKSIIDFSPNKSMRLGVQTVCKTCINSHKRNKQKTNEEYRLRCLKQSANFRRNNPRKAKSFILKTNYGITIEDYDKILEKQDGRCAICKTDTPAKSGRGSKSFHVDHNHKTNKIRGLLCSKCNQGLGYFNDEVRLLTLAIEYLEK